MILLYTLLMFLLNLIKFLVSVRSRALERKFIRLADAVDLLARQPDHKAGNSNKPDACLSAKRTFLLGQLVQQRDRVETKHFSWQSWDDRLNGWIERVRGWKGKKLPYTLGALDIWMLLHLIDYLGVGQYLSAANVIQMTTALFTN